MRIHQPVNRARREIDFCTERDDDLLTVDVEADQLIPRLSVHVAFAVRVLVHARAVDTKCVEPACVKINQRPPPRRKKTHSYTAGSVPPQGQGSGRRSVADNARFGAQ